jgi:hypothetical protein
MVLKCTWDILQDTPMPAYDTQTSAFKRTGMIKACSKIQHKEGISEV